jgi:hypothetical protein
MQWSGCSPTIKRDQRLIFSTAPLLPSMSTARHMSDWPCLSGTGFV